MIVWFGIFNRDVGSIYILSIILHRRGTSYGYPTGLRIPPLRSQVLLYLSGLRTYICLISPTIIS